MTQTQELKHAEARVATGEGYIARQRATIDRLISNKQDARAALELLGHLEAAQKILEGIATAFERSSSRAGRSRFRGMVGTAGNRAVSGWLKSLQIARQENAMERTIVAQFETRREAEIAVEHLVQEHGIPRSDIFIKARGEANSAGVKAAGADVESGHAGARERGSPELAGPIEISVDYHGDRLEMVRSALRDDGAKALKAK